MQNHKKATKKQWKWFVTNSHFYQPLKVSRKIRINWWKWAWWFYHNQKSNLWRPLHSCFCVSFNQTQKKTHFQSFQSLKWKEPFQRVSIVWEKQPFTFLDCWRISIDVRYARRQPHYIHCIGLIILYWRARYIQIITQIQ